MKKLYLVRHGETAWTLSGQHTGTTDLSLTDNGKKQSALLKDKLNGLHFDTIFTSPRLRALQTCEIAGFAERAIIDPRLVEWNYGAYEGLTSKQIHAHNPEWNIFQNGGPNGESTKDVERRIAQFLETINALEGNIAIFSHGHFLRALTVCFIGLPLITAKHFLLFPASVSLLAYEKTVPSLSLWNEVISDDGYNLAPYK